MIDSIPVAIATKVRYHSAERVPVFAGDVSVCLGGVVVVQRVVGQVDAVRETAHGLVLVRVHP